MNPTTEKINSLRRSVVLMLGVLSVPALEYLFLRAFIRLGLGVYIGIGKFTTDYRLIIPGLMAVFLFFVFHHALPESLPKFRMGAFKVNLALLVTFLAFNFCVAHFQIPLYRLDLLRFAWVGLAIATLGSACFVWLPPQFYFNREDAWLWALCVPVCLATTVVYHEFANIWDWMAPGIARVLKPVFTATGLNVECWFKRGSVFLKHPSLFLRIDRGCGGLDGFFIGSYAAVFCILKFKRGLSFVKSLSLVVLTWAMMFGLNVLRISTLFALGIILRSRFGEHEGATALTFLFHSGFASLLYLLGILQVAYLARWFASTESVKKLQLASQPG